MLSSAWAAATFYMARCNRTAKNEENKLFTNIMARDWKGGSASTFKTIGASNHCEHERADKDYYATEPAATD